MKILINVLEEPNHFVEIWSKKYNVRNNYLYDENIKTGLDNYDSFFNLFRWKNGFYNISKSKTRVVESFWDKVTELKTLKNSFDWGEFEDEYNPQNTSTIWKIFLLHISDPYNFPIFDVHVFRFHNFITTGKINEIPKNSRQKYQYYKNEYLPWFLELRDKYDLNPKKMDESFFMFGKKLKSLNEIPFITLNDNLVQAL